MNLHCYPRPDIFIDSAPGKQHTVIEASAGTGKTFTLEHLVLDLLINYQAKIEEILVVTFTEAATQELRERLRGIIRKVCDSPMIFSPSYDPHSFWLIDDQIKTRLREALFRFDGASISTIHGFCQRILSEQAFLSGKLLNLEHVNGEEAFSLAFRDEIRMALAESSTLNDNLKRWMTTGKSLNDLEIFLYKCHREGCPDRTLITPRWNPELLKEALIAIPTLDEMEASFSKLFQGRANKSYKEMSYSLYQLLEKLKTEGLSEELVSSFTGWMNKKRSINTVSASQLEHLSNACETASAAGPVASLHNALQIIEKNLAGLDSYFVSTLLPRIQSRLAIRKNALGLIDFDDMLLGVLKALNGREGPGLVGALRKRWKYALVDEFQDTDPVQWEIFYRIFVENSSQHKLFVIGDPKQAIYSFRGADVHTYTRAKETLQIDHGAKMLPLTKNFRSTEVMIAAVNKILTSQDQDGHTFFTGLNRYDYPVQCGDCSRFARDSSGETAVPVHLIQFANHRGDLRARDIRKQLYTFIAEEIIQLTSSEEALFTGKEDHEAKKIKLEDIFILTRTKSEGDQIGDTLRSYGIPHAYFKQEGLYQTCEAEDIYNLFQAISSPSDRAFVMKALLTPFFGLSLEELGTFSEEVYDHPLQTQLSDWNKLADKQDWNILFDRIVHQSGLLRRLVFAGDERSLTNYLHLLEVLQEEAHKHPATIRELSRWLKARIDERKLPDQHDGNIQRLDSEHQAVQILTMHKAKGLEAEVVFIGGGFSDGPVGGRITTKIYHQDRKRKMHVGTATGEIAALIKEEEREENERLLYVAITRAKSRLYLPHFGRSKTENGSSGKYSYKSISSLYQIMQQQLDLLNEKDFIEGKLFSTREACSDYGKNRKFVLPSGREENWPDKDLIKPTYSSAAEAASIKRIYRGPLVTSYTKIRRGEYEKTPSGNAQNSEILFNDERIGLEQKTELTPVEEEMQLPGGKETGIFLHSLFEYLPSDDLTSLSFEEWAGSPVIIKHASRAADCFGIDKIWLPEALRLVYNALTIPIDLKNIEGNRSLTMPGGLAAGEKQRREVPFIYPIPEESHPHLGQTRYSINPGSSHNHSPYRAVRGFLQGIIDLIFLHDNKVYMLDWKSDKLEAYDQEALNRHVIENYSLQAQVYTLALIRLLKISNEKDYNNLFGGIIYHFLRGFNDDNKGLWYSCPSWAQIMDWELGLQNRNRWGGVVADKSPAPTYETAGLDGE